MKKIVGPKWIEWCLLLKISLIVKVFYLWWYPQRDLVVYEMHVRGFTRHESSRTEFPGTYCGVVEKLDHLKVELISFIKQAVLLSLKVFFFIVRVIMAI